MNILDFAENVYFEDGLWFSFQKRDVSYPDIGNENSLKIEHDSFWFNHRNNCIIELVKKYSPGDIFFDIGGGNGFVAKGLEENNINTVLVEPGLKGALNAKKRGLENVVCATLEDAGFRTNAIKAIGLFDVVEHIEDDYKFLKSINAYLANEGMVYITVPAYNMLWSAEDKYGGHFRRYTLKKLNKVLNEAGFQIEFATYIFSILPVPIFLFRTFPSLIGININSQDINTHKKVHSNDKGIVMRFFDKIWNRELGNIKKQRKINFGGSCLVAARKTKANNGRDQGPDNMK